MTNTIRKGLLAGVVILVIAGLGFAWYRTHPPTPPEQQDEALVASPAREASSFPAADEDYFRDMDQNRGRSRHALARGDSRAAIRGSSGPPATIGCGTRSATTSVGALDFLKVAVLRIRLQSYSRGQPVGVLRPRQRAVLRQADGARSERVGVCGSISARPTARPIRSRTRRSIPACRPARAARR